MVVSGDATGIHKGEVIVEKNAKAPTWITRNFDWNWFSWKVINWRFSKQISGGRKGISTNSKDILENYLLKCLKECLTDF